MTIFDSTFYSGIDFVRKVGIDANGTLIKLPKDFDVRSGRQEGQQSPTLLAVNEKLSLLMQQIRERNGPLYQAYQQEIRLQRSHGFTFLDANLGRLNTIFREANDKSFYTRIYLAVVNAFRWLACLPPIVIKKYEYLDRTLFDPQNFLTENDRRIAVYRLKTSNGSNCPELTQDNLYSLELQLRDSIDIPCGRSSYTLKFNPLTYSFALSFYSRSFINIFSPPKNSQRERETIRATVQAKRPNGAVEQFRLWSSRKKESTPNGGWIISHDSSHPLPLERRTEYTLFPEEGSTAAPIVFSIS